MGYGYRESCWELFKALSILTLSSQYIFSLVLSLLIIGITLFQIVYIITLIREILYYTLLTCENEQNIQSSVYLCLVYEIVHFFIHLLYSSIQPQMWHWTLHLQVTLHS